MPFLPHSKCKLSGIAKHPSWKFASKTRILGSLHRSDTHPPALALLRIASLHIIKSTDSDSGCICIRPRSPASPCISRGILAPSISLFGYCTHSSGIHDRMSIFSRAKGCQSPNWNSLCNTPRDYSEKCLSWSPFPKV